MHKEVVWLFHELVFSRILILVLVLFFFNENKRVQNLLSSMMTNDYLHVDIFYLDVDTLRKKHTRALKGKYYIF